MAQAAAKTIGEDQGGIYYQRNKTGLPGKRQPSMTQSVQPTARGDLTVRAKEENTQNGKSAIQFYSTANTNVDQE